MKKTPPKSESTASADLPDVNVWLALVDETHAHHAAAKRYWNDAAAPRIAFTRVTMLGFLRLSTHARVLAKPLGVREAWSVYRQFLALPVIQFLQESPGLESRFAALTADAKFPHHLWTDAYLAAFALAGGCRLVSFDADFQCFPGLNFLRLTP